MEASAETTTATSSDPKAGKPPLTLEESVIAAMKKCYDPEIPVNIYEMGLIYSLDISPENAVAIKMTLTSPACPVAGSLPGDVERYVRAVPGVKDVKIELVWDPAWKPDMMSKLAKVMLGM